MEPFTLCIFVSAVVISVSYGWGMRGDLIGGEEGAMLPGAFLGFFLAVFSGSDIIRENFFIFSALGAASMFMGGTEPYAQTMSFAYWGKHNEKPQNYKKSMLGLAIKGSAWFGISGAFLGMGFSAVTGAIYKWYDFILLFLCIPLFRFLGVRLFNSPHKPGEKKYPKLYFSVTSREEWGGLWFIMAVLAILMAVRRDAFGLKMLLSGLISGSFGWMIAHSVNVLSCKRMKNGKFFFGSLQEKELIDNWKIMEFTYGALGSLGIAVCYAVNFDTVKAYGRILEKNGGIFSAFPGRLPAVLAWCWIGLLVIDAFHHACKNPGKRYRDAVTFFRRPLYCYAPLFLILTGSMQTARFESFLMLFWVAMEELCFVQLENHPRARIVPMCITIAGCGGILLAELLCPQIFTSAVTLCMYCFVYLGAQIYSDFFRTEKHSGASPAQRLLGRFHCRLTVVPHYIFCILLTLILFFTGGF